eukprot:2557739-Lingulodinium_polyedra.AAC.1
MLIAQAWAKHFALNQEDKQSWACRRAALKLVVEEHASPVARTVPIHIALVARAKLGSGAAG